MARKQMQVPKKHSHPKALERGLAQLQALLAALPPHQRRQTAELLSMQLRSALIQHGEVSRWKQLCRNKSLRQGASGSDTCRMSKDPYRLSHKSMRHRRGTGTVSAIRVGPGNIAYIARLTVNGITVSSRCTKSFKDAEQQRQLLAALNDVLEAMPGAFDRVFKAAFTPGEDLVDSRPLPLCISRLQESAWRFRVRVDARACAGRLLTSRSLTSVDEALRLREEAFVAKQHGWSALRSLWARCMSLRRQSQSCSRLAGLDASRELYVLKSQAPTSQDQIESKIWRLVPRLERRLAALAAVASGVSQSSKSLQSQATQANEKRKAKSLTPIPEMLQDQMPEPVKLDSEISL